MYQASSRSFTILESRIRLKCRVLCRNVLLGSGYGAQQPPWFKFGAGTSALQIEGGWNASGNVNSFFTPKRFTLQGSQYHLTPVISSVMERVLDRGESNWDRYLHLFPKTIAGSADVTCDSYRLWRRDIQMCQELGLDMYRFSISWSRLLPTGLSNYISEDGKNYYNNLINGLLEKGIEPVVTLNHFDLPQRLQNLGGWTNPLISNWFAEYARVAFSLYADRVKIWLTVNEPQILCDSGYNNGTVPYINDPKYGRYLCSKNVLLAHAKAYRIYDRHYRHLYHGKVTIVFLYLWLAPATENDIEVTNLARQYVEGRYGHPVYSKEGGWPKELEEILANNSRNEGYPEPRLPPFTEEEKELVKGSFDFYALNHYSSLLVRKAKPGEVIGKTLVDGIEELGIVLESDPSWEKGDIKWLTVHPEGLREQLNYLKNTYNLTEIMITENGFFSSNASLNDVRTVNYTKKYLEQVALAIQDGVNVTVYFHWSLMDNFDKGYE
ncbi:hypothetical protein HW555_003300 [Spodoptera exigua]|uniref:Myrosinase 1-like n=1 Tax=Spodoptera exigua TaxID=7107 RepID=A0A835GLL1_SPOEX|nr:hypothetical protein HW555_003300 [Spodoptera exigua]